MSVLSGEGSSKVIITTGAFKGRTGMYVYDQIDEGISQSVVRFEDGLELPFNKSDFTNYTVDSK